MPRYMADSVSARDIPQGRFALVGGYVDGVYAWSAADWAYHHDSTPVRITVTGNTTEADVADVENGDLTPAQGAAWCNRKIAAGGFPTLYFSWSRRGEIAAAVAAARVNHYRQWAALWDNRAVLDAGDVAKQYADSAMVGAHYDLSVVADYWPGVDAAPVYLGYLGGSMVVVSGATTNLDAMVADIQRQQLIHPGSSYEIRLRSGALVRYFPPLGGVAPPPPPLPTPAPPPLPTPAPPPVVTPPPAAADAQSAQASFWALVAENWGRGLPALFNAILDYLRHTREI